MTSSSRSSNMYKRRYAKKSFTNSPYKRPRKTIPANISTTALARAAKAYAPATVPRGIRGNQIAFPKTKVVKMRYADWHSLIGAAGILSVHAYRANSIFDPDQTGAGHQAMGHDQWETFYENYTVTKSKITVYVTPTGTGLTSPPIVGIALVNTTAAFGSTWQTNVERGMGTFKQIPITTNAAGPPTKLTCGFDAKSFFNLQDVKDNQARIGAPMGADPPTPGDAFFVVWGQSQDAAIALNCDVTVVIDYTVLLSDPRQLPAS